MKNLIPAYRDGLLLYTRGEVFLAGDAVIEVLYNKAGKTKTFFAELLGTPACSHGSTVEEAVKAAREKRGETEPITENEKKKYRKANYRFTVRLFRKLTRACKTGCDAWLAERGLKPDVTMTLKEFREAGGGVWADRVEEAIS